MGPGLIEVGYDENCPPGQPPTDDWTAPCSVSTIRDVFWLTGGGDGVVL